MLGEYMQEMTQQQLQNKYSGKEYGTFWNPTEDEMQAGRAAAMGALPTGLFGSVRGVRHSLRGGSDAQTQAVNDAIRAQQAEADAEFSPVDFGSTDVNAPELATPKDQENKAGADVLSAAQGYIGKHMDNGENGCAEAVTKIGANYNSFLADELGKGVVNVDTLVKDAGDNVIPFDASDVQAGDVIVYGDNDHVVLADGNGGYVGNSSSQQKVVQGDDYNEMGGLKATKIIKTGGSEGLLRKWRAG